MITGLVVSTPLKNMKVNCDGYSQYMKNMFQTTNQIMSLAISILLVSLLQHLEPKMAGIEYALGRCLGIPGCTFIHLPSNQTWLGKSGAK
jgi:hypothetical protein